jgi:hypothetical protein
VDLIWILWVAVGLVIVLVVVPGVVVFTKKVVTIIQKAAEPPHIDQHTYTLNQAREVRSEHE